MDSTQILSKSLDFEEITTKPKKTINITTVAIKTNPTKKTTESPKFRRSSAKTKKHTKIENLFENTEKTTEFPKKPKEPKSPWAFQIFKTFHSN